MKYIVDSETVIDFFKGKTELFPIFDDSENIFISVISLGELFYKAESIENQKDVLQICKDFCQFLSIVEVGEQIASKYSVLKLKYPDIEEKKLWIAATAVCKDLVLVTSDKSYSIVKEIVVKEYS